MSGPDGDTPARSATPPAPDAHTLLTERTPPGRRAALAAMLFLQHSILGAWVPLLPLHLQDLNFTGEQIGWIYSTLAIASILAPWLGGQLADRMIAPERVMAISHILGGITLWAVAAETEFKPFLLLILLNALIHMPTLAISNAIAFRHLRSPRIEYGGVRLWGTTSWVAMALLLGWWFGQFQALGMPSPRTWLGDTRAAASLADCLRLGGVFSFLLAGYCLFLPHSRAARRSGRRGIAALDVFGLFRDRSFAVLMVVSFLIATLLPFIYPIGGIYLRARGTPDAAIAPLLSLGQLGEIVAFVLLAGAVRRWGVKTTFLIGLAAWCVRFGAWSLGGSWIIVIGIIPIHGICYAFFMGLGQIYVDQHARDDTRASTQSLYQVMTFGLGSWIGNLIAGGMLDAFQDATPEGQAVNFSLYYLAPTLIAAACFVIFAVYFRDDEDAPRTARNQR